MSTSDWKGFHVREKMVVKRVRSLIGYGPSIRPEGTVIDMQADGIYL